MLYRIEETDKRYKRIYYTCGICNKETQMLLRVKIEEFKFLCRKCKLRETNLKIYGVNSRWKVKAIVEKRKNTCLDRFGTETVLSNKIIRAKGIETLKKLYGVDNPTKSYIIKSRVKKTFLKNYGVESQNQAEVVKEKKRKTCREKYGVDNPFKFEDFKIKFKKTCREKYGVDNPNKLEEVKEKKKVTYFRRYGVDHPWKVPEIHKEAMFLGFEAKKRNGTVNASKPEEKVFFILKSKYPNVIRQHSTDKRYPFACDFYIPEKDLFIECNFHWTHEKMPYIKGDIQCENKLKILQEKAKFSSFYAGAIKTWTIRDVLKRETAKRNNLNYIEIFNLEAAEKI